MWGVQINNSEMQGGPIPSNIMVATPIGKSRKCMFQYLLESFSLASCLYFLGWDLAIMVFLQKENCVKFWQTPKWNKSKTVIIVLQDLSVATVSSSWQWRFLFSCRSTNTVRQRQSPLHHPSSYSFLFLCRGEVSKPRQIGADGPLSPQVWTPSI